MSSPRHRTAYTSQAPPKMERPISSYNCNSLFFTPLHLAHSSNTASNYNHNHNDDIHTDNNTNPNNQSQSQTKDNLLTPPPAALTKQNTDNIKLQLQTHQSLPINALHQHQLVEYTPKPSNRHEKRIVPSQTCFLHQNEARLANSNSKRTSSTSTYIQAK